MQKKNRHDLNMALVDRLTLARLAVAELDDAGFAVESVDVSQSAPLIHVRHSRHCGELHGECLARGHGPKEHWAAPYKGAYVTWTVDFGQGEVVSLPQRAAP